VQAESKGKSRQARANALCGMPAPYGSTSMGPPKKRQARFRRSAISIKPHCHPNSDAGSRLLVSDKHKFANGKTLAHVPSPTVSLLNAAGRPLADARFGMGECAQLLEDRGVQDLVQPRERTASNGSVEYAMIKGEPNDDVAGGIGRSIAQHSVCQRAAEDTAQVPISRRTRGMFKHTAQISRRANNGNRATATNRRWNLDASIGAQAARRIISLSSPSATASGLWKRNGSKSRSFSIQRS
jgi:hypothetical protein